MNLEQLSKFFTAFLLNIELTWRLILDFKVSFMTKILFVFMIFGYFIFPIDFVPDFFPVVGQMDDALVFVFCMMQFVKACPEEIVEHHKQSILRGEWRIGFLKFFTGHAR